MEFATKDVINHADPSRCVHIGDRESDIFELFCLARELGTHFLVRTCVDRLAADGNTTVAAEMTRAKLQGLHRIQVGDSPGKMATSLLEMRFRRIVVHPPRDKEKKYPDLVLTAIYAQERSKVRGREKINWKLLTDLPARSCLDAVETLEWHAQRWKIETFHKILKSGCWVEDAKLRTAKRLVNLIAIFCILSWRIFWITMLNRTSSAASPDEAFTELDQYLLDELLPDNTPPPRAPAVAHYVVKLARLGGATLPAPRMAHGQHRHLEKPVPINRHRTAS